MSSPEDSIVQEGEGPAWQGAPRTADAFVDLEGIELLARDSNGEPFNTSDDDYQPAHAHTSLGTLMPDLTATPRTMSITSALQAVQSTPTLSIAIRGRKRTQTKTPLEKNSTKKKAQVPAERAIAKKMTYTDNMEAKIIVWFLECWC